MMMMLMMMLMMMMMMMVMAMVMAMVVLLAVLLMTALMGPVRGPLLLFPYGLMALWLGWSWGNGRSWWLSWPVGVVLGSVGFLVRVLVLSLLVGENLWVVITRAGAI